MSDKPTGPAAAAREIDRQWDEWHSWHYLHFPPHSLPSVKEREKTIEAIILKHSFEDRAVGLLVEACKEFVRKVECGEARSRRSYAQMKAALAEHKNPSCDPAPSRATIQTERDNKKDK